MNIKDSILTGFGAGLLAAGGEAIAGDSAAVKDLFFREEEPEIPVPEGDFDSCLFYMGSEKPGAGVYFEFISARFLDMARQLVRAGKTVYVVTRNMVCPSYGELDYAEARRAGVLFIHLEEGQSIALRRWRGAHRRRGKGACHPGGQDHPFRRLRRPVQGQGVPLPLQVGAAAPLEPHQMGQKAVPCGLHQASAGQAVGAEGEACRPGRDASRPGRGEGLSGSGRRAVQRVRLLQGGVSPQRHRDGDEGA